MRCIRLCGLTGLLLLAGTAAQAAEPALIPWPAQVAAAAGSFTVDRRTALCAAGAASAIAEQLQAVVKAAQGLDLAARSCDGIGIALVLSRDARVADAEGYTLDVGPAGMRIEARAAAGLYYGAMTAAQLLSGGAAPGAPVSLAGVHIEDLPRFKWRGLMMDSARHFATVADVKRMLDQMGQHKLNVLHLRLSDDQGWRIEIRRYPELTTIGAWRTTPVSDGRPGTERYGGYYSQQDIRELVQYAAARHIMIVPELDMPGHAQAVVAAHPRLGVAGERPAVSSSWGVNYHLYNPDAYSLGFVKHVLDEIMGLFPGNYIHLGGDEAIKDQWRDSPAVQAQIKSLGLADEDALQGWFMGQVGRYLAEHGRTMLGWDEILEAAVPENAVVMSWRGTQGAITAARLGHDVVLASSPALYFDYLQSSRDDEPAGRVGVTALSHVYGFEAMPAMLNAEESRHILGAQANLWSEYLVSRWHLERAAFPRIDALAELVWTAPARMSWAGFLARLPAQLRRYARQDITAADSAFAVGFEPADGRTAALQAGAGAVTLLNQTGFGEIRYTLDGSAPTLQSRLYAAPLALELGAMIKATAFGADGLPLAAERTYRFDRDTLLTRSSSQLQACAGHNLTLRLPLTPDAPAAGPAFSVNVLNSCSIYPKAPLGGVKALRFDIARLPRNFAFANRKGQLQPYPARTPFGELIVYRDRCASGAELGSAALADPATSGTLQQLDIPLAPGAGEHDLCFIFTGSATGPLYAIAEVKLLQP